MAIDRAKFFAGIRNGPFPGTLAATTVQGVNAILDEWERRKLTDLRWLAYMLATVLAECGRNMLPVREGFKGSDAAARAYVRGRGYKYAAVVNGQVYYGRGLVQLTWEDNYRKMGELLGLDLLGQPDLALVPSTAAAIMFEGMIRGSFTGKKLADFFNATTTDWKNARTIINRLDRADEIAGYAKQFHDDLKAADVPSVKDIATSAARDAGIGGAATGAAKTGETAVVPATPDAGLPWMEILIAAAVIGVLVFVGSFAWRWWKARQAAGDSAVAADTPSEASLSDTASAPKRLSKAASAMADDIAASIAKRVKARRAVAKSAVRQRIAKKKRRARS